MKLIDAGRARFNEKFNVLNKHKQFFKELKQLNKIAESIKGLVRRNGLSLNTLHEIEQIFDDITYPTIKKVYYNIINYLQDQHAKCVADKVPMLCCSDIIESIFGKYKMKIQQPVGAFMKTVLSIALICSKFSIESIRSILSNLRMSDVDQWFLSMAGVSNLAKRRMAFG